MDRETLSRLNPGLGILESGDAALARYARPLRLEGLGLLLAAADGLVPSDLGANAYVASSPALEVLPESRTFAPCVGFVEYQVGWNAGPNSTLNGLEWHKSAEILVAVSDLAVFLGRVEDLEHGPDGLGYETSRLACLFLHRGEALEIMPGTLHLAPCKVTAAGFKSLVVLPRGTNTPLSDAEREAARGAVRRGNEEAAFVFMRNKWIIAHPERAALVDAGALPRLRGPNLAVRFE